MVAATRLGLVEWWPDPWEDVMRVGTARLIRWRPAGPRSAAVRPGGTTGSSLLEIIVATLILGLVAINMVTFFAKGRVWFDQEEHKRVATLLAQESLERTVARTYAQIADWSESRRVASIPYTIAVAVIANSPETDIKTVTAVVTWPATSSSTRSVAAATYVFNN
jgi:hypothetical protein